MKKSEYASHPDLVRLFGPVEQEAQSVKEDSHDYGDYFTIRPVNEWIDEAKLKQKPKMLFGEFWHEGELCILFSDTNLGKSILAVQMGDSISLGKELPGFKLEADKQPVLYFDFELTAKQFENRYSNEYTDHYIFDENLQRVEINPDAECPEKKTFDEYLMESLELAIKKSTSKIIIIDNITFLGNEHEKAKDALPLMKHLKKLKNMYELSILALAHTPKRDSSKPICKNDLQGSRMILNFCDSAFAIGESQKDSLLRYLKQIKQRNTEQIYGPENVCICKINKPDNFLKFELIEYDYESNHLKTENPQDRQERNDTIVKLHGQGKSSREIADQMGTISHMQVTRIVKQLIA